MLADFESMQEGSIDWSITAKLRIKMLLADSKSILLAPYRVFLEASQLTRKKIYKSL